MRTLKVNKVPLVDQVAKIRALLSGHPLSMVPESLRLSKHCVLAMEMRKGS